MIDTIVCSTKIRNPLPSTLFDGGSFTFSGNQRFARFWLNDSKEYAPRVTYWRMPRQGDELPIEASEAIDEIHDGTLRLEFSLKKFPIERVDGWLAERFHDLAPFATWTTTRIDYCYDWLLLGNIENYLKVFKRLRLASMQANVYDSGVMWKSITRTIKFYNKSKEQGFGAGLLRFEVSNNRQALAYMCDQWFHCDRTVGQLVHEGRALYVLTYYWNKLGLGSVEQYSTETDEFLRIAGAFGNRANTAWFVLKLLREFGTDAIKRGLVSTTTFYLYKRELTELGFITNSEAPVGTLPALHLPVGERLHVSTQDA